VASATRVGSALVIVGSGGAIEDKAVGGDTVGGGGVGDKVVGRSVVIGKTVGEGTVGGRIVVARARDIAEGSGIVFKTKIKAQIDTITPNRDTLLSKPLARMSPIGSSAKSVMALSGNTDIAAPLSILAGR